MHTIPLAGLWQTQSTSTVLISLGQPVSTDVQLIRVTLCSLRRSGFRFHLDFLDASLCNGYRTVITTEWQGDNTIDLPVCAIKPIGQPAGWESITSLRLSSDESTRDDVIEIKSVAWSTSVLPRPINPYEDALETFFLQSFWRVDDWLIKSNLPPERIELQSFWFWAQLVLHSPAPGDWISMERHYPEAGITMADYESLVALISFESTASCAIQLKIGGEWSITGPGVPGEQNFRELITDVRGTNHLEAIRVRMECSAEGVSILTGIVSWILLQRSGADPLAIRRYGAHISHIPSPRPTPGKLEEEGLVDGLFLSRSDIPALRQKASQGIGSLMWQKIKTEADKYLAYDPEPHVGQYLPIRRGESLTRRFVEAAPSFESMIPQLGIAYLVTGDDTYGNQLKRVILAACRCSEWGTAFIDRFPVGIWGYRAPFWPSHMASAVAVGADMISNLLSEDEREFIDIALIDKGLFWVEEYVERNDYCRYMNQGVVFAAGGIMAALSVEKRHPAVAARRHKLAAYLLDVLDRYLDEDGATGEGPAYWNYTLSQASRTLVPLARCDGISVAAQVTLKLANSVNYPFYLRSMAGDGFNLLNIGDGGYGNRILSPLLLFFANYLNRSDAMQVWLDQYGHGDAVPNDAWSFLFYNPDIVPRPLNLPLNKHFHGSDRVFWRSGWDRGDILFMFESGNWGPDHYHFDKHQFLLEAFGERMIVDRGMCDYSNPLSLVLNTTASHNTVTVDGRDQTAQNHQPAAHLEKVVESDMFRYLSSEASAAYADLRLFRREVLFARSRYFVLTDTLTGLHGQLAWHFHTPMRPQPIPGGLLLRGTQSSLILAIIQPQPWEWREELLPLDVDVTADQLFNRLGVSAKIEQDMIAPYSDHHLMLSPSGQPEQTQLLAILYPIATGDEHTVKITQHGEPATRLITIDQAGLCDELDVASVWRTNLLSALRFGSTPNGQ